MVQEHSKWDYRFTYINVARTSRAVQDVTKRRLKNDDNFLIRLTCAMTFLDVGLKRQAIEMHWNKLTIYKQQC